MNNDAYKLKYMKYKAKYLELKEMLGGAEAEKYVVGMRVKRVKGDDDVYADGSIHRGEAIGKYGIIKEIREEEEWPPGSGKILPKAYIIDFKNHYEGTKHEGVLISVIEDDLEPVEVNMIEKIRILKDEMKVLNDLIIKSKRGENINIFEIIKEHSRISKYVYDIFRSWFLESEEGREWLLKKREE